MSISIPLQLAPNQVGSHSASHQSGLACAPVSLEESAYKGFIQVRQEMNHQFRAWLATGPLRQDAIDEVNGTLGVLNGILNLLLSPVATVDL